MGKASRRKRGLSQGELRKALDAEEQQVGGRLLAGQEICDFCSSPDPQWAYRTEDDPTEGGKPGGWAACDVCHDLIERMHHDALARRSATTFRERHKQLHQVPLKTLTEEFRKFHDGFRRNRVGPVMTREEYVKEYGPGTVSRVGQFMQDTGIDILTGQTERPGDQIGTVAPPGDQVLHHVFENSESHYIPEGFTAEQLADPRTVEYIMQRIEHDRPAPNISLTQPMKPIKQWVGARNYLDAVAAVYGENPRADDIFAPRPAMIMARLILEPILDAHPVVLEPEQMNAIDDEDWSFAESIEYAKMAHLPFEPIYLDFGGHEPVWVELEAGSCQLHGAVVWRSGFFKLPTLAIAPIGGFDYLTGPLADMLIAEGIDQKRVIEYVGLRPGKEIHEGESIGPTTRSQFTRGEQNKWGRKERNQWLYQPAGICWFGIETPGDHPYVTMGQRIIQDRGPSDTPLVFSTGAAVANAVKESRLLEDPRQTQANVLTGMFDDPSKDDEPFEGWSRMMQVATEMVARLSERALLGLYFIENAPVDITQTPLSRPERREMERKAKKGKDPGEVASLVVIQSKRSDSTRPEVPGDRSYTHRWERRGYAMHIHENNRHYQNRPDLVKPCHKCQVEYAENERARREGKAIPHPHCESPDCIKIWIFPTVCGPEDKPLKKKVRIKRVNRKRDG